MRRRRSITLASYRGSYNRIQPRPQTSKQDTAPKQCCLHCVLFWFFAGNKKYCYYGDDHWHAYLAPTLRDDDNDDTIVVVISGSQHLVWALAIHWPSFPTTMKNVVPLKASLMGLVIGSKDPKVLFPQDGMKKELETITI
ncbi:hypothetical protein BS47DRAFT_1379943, partial [Hydnum rufescens UP504]